VVPVIEAVVLEEPVLPEPVEDPVEEVLELPAHAAMLNNAASATNANAMLRRRVKGMIKSASMASVRAAASPTVPGRFH
jgi:hypothetical protein